MAAAEVPPFIIERAMIDCGVTIATLFNGSTHAQRIATDVFSDDFNIKQTKN